MDNANDFDELSHPALLGRLLRSARNSESTCSPSSEGPLFCPSASSASISPGSKSPSDSCCSSASSPARMSASVLTYLPCFIRSSIMRWVSLVSEMFMSQRLHLHLTPFLRRTVLTSFPRCSDLQHHGPMIRHRRRQLILGGGEVLLPPEVADVLAAAQVKLGEIQRDFDRAGGLLQLCLRLGFGAECGGLAGGAVEQSPDRFGRGLTPTRAPRRDQFIAAAVEQSDCHCAVGKRAGPDFRAGRAVFRDPAG